MPNCAFRLAGVVLLLAVILSNAGCKVYSSARTVPDLPEDPSSAESGLGQGLFRVVKDHVEGEACCSHILYLQYPGWLNTLFKLGLPYATGIALEDNDLRKRAMADLRKNHELRAGTERLNNIIEEWSVSNYLGLYAEITLKISAEVVEFVQET
jgi:hypothetical protein